LEEPGGGPGATGWFAEGPLRRLLSNASLLIGGRSLNAVFNVAAMTLIVRSVGLETFGLLALVHAVMSSISDLAKFQSWQAVLRYGTSALEDGRTQDFRRLVKLTVLLDLSSAIFGILVAVIAVPVLAPRLDWAPEWIPTIQVYALSIFFMVTATPTGLLRLFDRFDLLSVSNAIGSSLRVLGAVWVFAFGGGLELLLVIWFASTVASGAWLIGHAYRTLSSRGLLQGPRLGLRGLGAGHEGITAFVWTTQANTTLSSAMRHLTTVIVGYLLTPAAAGLYDISRQVTTLLSRFAKLMQPAIYPEFARLSVKNDMPAVRQLILRSMALMTGAGTLLVVPLLLFGRPLLGFAFGKELEAAYGLVVLMALAAAVRLLSFPLEPALISTGRAGTALVIRATTVAVFLVGLFSLIPRLGVVGAGVAGLASGMVAFLGEAIAAFTWFRSRATRAGSPPRESAPGGSVSSGSVSAGPPRSRESPSGDSPSREPSRE
jgi:O-antigen/teichoic acid export membrane protein